jgi:hypothetical protein
MLAIKSRRIRREGHVTCMGDRKDAYRVLVRNSKAKNHSEKRTCKDNISTDLKETGWEGFKWIDLAQDKGQVPSFKTSQVFLIWFPKCPQVSAPYTAMFQMWHFTSFFPEFKSNLLVKRVFCRVILPQRVWLYHIFPHHLTNGTIFEKSYRT